MMQKTARRRRKREKVRKGNKEGVIQFLGMKQTGGTRTPNTRTEKEGAKGLANGITTVILTDGVDNQASG